jgi:hypothetical protein
MTRISELHRRWSKDRDYKGRVRRPRLRVRPRAGTDRGAHGRGPVAVTTRQTSPYDSIYVGTFAHPRYDRLGDSSRGVALTGAISEDVVNVAGLSSLSRLEILASVFEVRKLADGPIRGLLS